VRTLSIPRLVAKLSIRILESSDARSSPLERAHDFTPGRTRPGVTMLGK
jgi:hypothetical protein